VQQLHAVSTCNSDILLKEAGVDLPANASANAAGKPPG